MIESTILTTDFEVLTVDHTGQPLQQVRHSARCRAIALSPGITLHLIEIPAGHLLIGAPTTEEGWQASQGPQQPIQLASFWIGQVPITQAQWQCVAAFPKVNRDLPPQPACFAHPQCPVEQVSWLDAVEWCDRLSALTRHTYRLPSEAEWEYACRAGTQTPFHFGDTLSTEIANYSGVNWEYEGRLCSQGFYGKGAAGSDRRETTQVGMFGVANAFGLYDMHGLVREWCADCWHPNYSGIPLDGTAWITGGNCTQRVLRGGSWNTSPRSCRSAFRSKSNADGGLYDIGFRVVCDMLQDSSA